MKQKTDKWIYIILIAVFLALMCTFALSWSNVRSAKCTVFQGTCYYPMPFPEPPQLQQVYLPLVVNGEPGPTQRPTPTLAPTMSWITPTPTLAPTQVLP